MALVKREATEIGPVRDSRSEVDFGEHWDVR